MYKLDKSTDVKVITNMQNDLISSKIGNIELPVVNYSNKNIPSRQTSAEFKLPLKFFNYPVGTTIVVGRGGDQMTEIVATKKENYVEIKTPGFTSRLFSNGYVSVIPWANLNSSSRRNSIGY